MIVLACPTVTVDLASRLLIVLVVVVEAPKQEQKVRRRRFDWPLRAAGAAPRLASAQAWSGSSSSSSSTISASLFALSPWKMISVAELMTQPIPSRPQFWDLVGVTVGKVAADVTVTIAVAVLAAAVAVLAAFFVVTTASMSPPTPPRLMLFPVAAVEAALTVETLLPRTVAKAWS